MVFIVLFLFVAYLYPIYLLYQPTFPVGLDSSIFPRLVRTYFSCKVKLGMSLQCYRVSITQRGCVLRTFHVSLQGCSAYLCLGNVMILFIRPVSVSFLSPKAILDLGGKPKKEQEKKEAIRYILVLEYSRKNTADRTARWNTELDRCFFWFCWISDL